MKKFAALIISLLCAVVISAFGACDIVNKSNVSSDTLMVKNMNTALTVAGFEEKPQDVSDVIEICLENGYDVKNITLSSDDYVLYWDSEANLILIWSESDCMVIYPDSYDGISVVQGTWYSLTE